MRDQLNREWNAVPAVWAFINTMQKALINSQGNASQITTVANDVNASVQASPQVTYDQAAILSDMLWILSTIPVVNGVADFLNGFLKTSAATAQLPGENLLSNTFTPWTDDNKVSHPPLFNILQFARETYANATTNTHAVTHILQTQTNLNTVSTNLWCQTS